MKIPNHIKMGAHKINVSVSQGNIEGFGSYSDCYNLIKIESDVDYQESNTAQIFLREIIEAIKFKYALSIDQPNLIVLSEVLFQILVDNKLNFGKGFIFPESIKVGAHKIDVELVLPRNITGSGSYNNYYNLIRIEKDFDSQESNMAEVFLHEIIECVKLKYELSIDHPHLTVLSEILFQVFRDNKLNFGKCLV